MLRAPLPLVSALLLAGLLAGCSSTPDDKTAGWSPNRIYSEATDERAAGNFERAAQIIDGITTAETFETFLTLPAYRAID